MTYVLPKLWVKFQVVAGELWVNKTEAPCPSAAVDPGILIEAVPFVVVTVTPEPVKLKYEAVPWVTSSLATVTALSLAFKAYDAVKAFEALKA